MSASRRSYRYVGPEHLRAAVQPGDGGTAIRTAAEFTFWAAARNGEELAEPFTFVVAMDGVLRLAPRRSEHVSCAGGKQVLSAGEMAFHSEAGRWAAEETSNQSTGYCPDAASWPAVAHALDQVGLEHPDRFTHEVVFRRCPDCQEHNIVREGYFVCVFCDADLPQLWNVDPDPEDPEPS
ncbi:hypothetical protein G3I60_30405 [Streptomyces sp. SID13666]|uniref:hypothetical protein n=1 Tax=unclassified Streptomyces TaxID=2593676 RepID=UPI0013C170B2|nr:MULTISPECIES: hypothetical protein [unclassified Streptomyces]NEA58347.1 hypothetical protein [Streptomyces sp. SID13666]NEA69171.1 hypothetical protein [Streptomyces sp. SID13588]